MRILIAVPLLVLGACNVDRDAGNGTTTVSFDESAAANTAEDVGAAAENIGGVIANDVEKTADKVQNKVGDVDVDVDVSRNGDANANAQ
jgi:hypothetical protein